MKTALLLLADGFEEIEALATVDILRRAKTEVTTASVGFSREVTGAHGITVRADTLLSGYKQPCDVVILPGGGKGTDNLKASSEVAETVAAAFERGAYVAAICAAPTVLAGLGLLNKKRAVCFPGFEQTLTDAGATVGNESVCVDGSIITSRAAGTTGEFAFKLVELLSGKDTADKLRRAMLWE